MPVIPCIKQEKQYMHFFGRDAVLPVLVAAVMGLQHAFAMVGGLITPGYVVMKFSVDEYPFEQVDLQQYAISSALIVSGLCTIMNVVQIPIPYSEHIFGKKIVIGTGVISVMGTSFSFLPIWEIAIGTMKADGISGRDAYGKMLGTTMVCSFTEILLSFVPIKELKRVFPPMVTGVTVMLIGVALAGAGMKYWGGKNLNIVSIRLIYTYISI
jgi:xanthine/uracil permease